jgi:5-methylcytosine-specific restriction endonuclease McrA
MVKNRKLFYTVSQVPKIYLKYPKGSCLNCGSTLPPLKRSFCKTSCQKEHYLATRPYKFISWGTIRMEILKRDKNKCYDCKETFKDTGLDIHHKTPLYKGGAEFNKNNLITLCISCHKFRHRKRGTEFSRVKKLNLFL